VNSVRIPLTGPLRAQEDCRPRVLPGAVVLLGYFLGQHLRFTQSENPVPPDLHVPARMFLDFTKYTVNKYTVNLHTSMFSVRPTVITLAENMTQMTGKINDGLRIYGKQIYGLKLAYQYVISASYGFFGA
jgi:hypothetical protein